MKSVSGTAFVWTIVIAVLAIGVAFWGGSKSFESTHGCTVDPTTKKATCTK